MTAQSTSIVSHGEVEKNATEVYGQGSVVLRIGNGGAGATGLIKELAEDYLKRRGGDGSIEWVCNHSRNTQLALMRGYIDVALTYERDQEALAESEGWSRSAGCAFHDHFCLAGPVSDPAGVASSSSMSEAFAKIASTGSLFHSRADLSATMWKERSIWAKLASQPWNDAKTAPWYKKSLLSPAEALKKADAADAYCLTDRSTLLRQTALGTMSKLTVFFEPTDKDDILMNSCYALYSPAASGEIPQQTSLFLDYVFSTCGQRIIKTFGVSETGLPLFAPVSEEFSKSTLIGGKAVGGKWTVGEKKLASRL